MSLELTGKLLVQKIIQLSGNVRVALCVFRSQSLQLLGTRGLGS